jgi:hypothetical protein
MLRRKLLLSQEERPGRMLLGHHNINDDKQLISRSNKNTNKPFVIIQFLYLKL